MKKEIADKILEKVKADYEATASEFSDSRGYLWEELKQFEKYVKGNMNILDLGCGNGRLYEIFKDKKINYTGIDNCAPLIKLAQVKWISSLELKTLNQEPKNQSSKFKVQSSKSTFIVGDALDLKFEDNKFDIVFSVAVLHQIPSIELRLKVLQNISRVLKKGGNLVMTNWNLWQPKYFPFVLKNNIKKLIGLSKFDFNDSLIPWHQSGINRYYHAFTKFELTSLLSRTNFKVVEQYYVKKGQKANGLNGYNLVTVANKKHWNITQNMLNLKSNHSL